MVGLARVLNLQLHRKCMNQTMFRRLSEQLQATHEKLSRRILKIPARHPLVFGIVYSTAKTGFADYLVQRYVEKKKRIDWTRNLSFSLFGFFYLGAWQYFLYCKIFPNIFSTVSTFAKASWKEKLRNRKVIKESFLQLVLDQFVHHPWVYFPSFYLCNCLVNGTGASHAWSLFKSNFIEDIFTLWKIWIPVMTFNFTFAPLWARVPVVATTSLLWTMIVSALRGNSASTIVEDEDFESKDVLDMAQDVVDMAVTEVLGAAEAIHSVPDAEDIGDQAWMALTGVLNARAVVDPDEANFVVTIGGKNLHRMMMEIEKWIEQNEGHIKEQKMMVYGSYGSLMLLISSKKENKARLRFGLERMDRWNKMNVAVMEAQVDSGYSNDPLVDKSKVFVLNVMGPEKGGIVSGFSGILTKYGFNIENLRSGAEPGPSGMIASVNMVCSVENLEGNTLEEVNKDFKALGKELGLQYDLKAMNRNLTWLRAQRAP